MHGYIEPKGKNWGLIILKYLGWVLQLKFHSMQAPKVLSRANIYKQPVYK